ncbi:polyketide cyclase [Subtercola boreus]|uniref:Polyketide cyclase n=1 Tax=Subtercola boreus TaxID=120213 RepID=A0A3E0VPZ1_9MICO|nr:SRPBCC family protein [Subtercola boreus]RFA10927.1 polyketide cyclase [Subtercola boreus]TQL55479.1 hypothetical protein FB464_3045 [Subtercola boreus]
MAVETRHLSIGIQRPAGEVYAFVREPSNLPQWASGLSAGIRQVDGRWVADSPMGEVEVRFAPPNDFGVVDHLVTLPGGETFDNPMRVLAVGSAAEVVFTLLRMPGVTDADFERDAATILSDLAVLKRVLEG